MAQVKFLSPSQLGLFESKPESYYLKYLAPVRQREPQTQPMSIGSAFDAYVKSRLIVDLQLQSDLTFEILFESQVEPHNRDWALSTGKFLFDEYVRLGSYIRIRRLLEKSSEQRLEFKLEQTVDGIPLLGKPDLKFQYNDITIILDWKCNGICSKYATSPCRCYRRLSDGKKITRHKDYVSYYFDGIPIHAGYLEEINTDWADQLSIYSWLLGNKNKKTVFFIEQLVAKPTLIIRAASFRCRISDMYQHILVERLKRMWGAITNNHIFLDMSIEDSQQRCELLDKQSCLEPDWLC